MADWDPTKQTYADYLISTWPGNNGRSPFPGDQPGAATPTTPGPAAPPAAPSLEQDPTYLAFVRALDSQRALAGNQAETQREQLQRGLADQMPGIARQGQYARENISGGFETRGLFHSGQHEQSLARQRQAEGDRVAALRSNEANAEAGLNAGLAQQYANLDQRLAEQRMSAAQRQQEHDDALKLQQQAAAGSMPTIDGGLGALSGSPPTGSLSTTSGNYADMLAGLPGVLRKLPNVSFG